MISPIVGDLDALEYEDETTVDDFGDFPLISREQSLIAQLEATQKEITDWRSVAEAAAQDDADWHKLVDSKNDVISRLASGIINLKAQMEAAQRDRNLHYRVSEKLRIKLIAAEAELSAANEKLSKAVVLPDDGLEDCINMWPDNWRNDFDTGYNFGLWRCEQNIKAAGFTVEGE